MNIQDRLREKREQILGLAAKHGASNVRVFGSVARGQAGTGSDVDFLVSLDPGTTLIQHAALARKLRRLLGVRVHVVSERALRDAIKGRIMEEAVPL